MTDPRDREIGELNRENIRRLLSSLALYPFTQRQGMTIEAFQAMITQARAEAADPSLKAYFPLWVPAHSNFRPDSLTGTSYVCIGRKPGG